MTPVFQWLAEHDRRAFRLAPFRVEGPDADATVAPGARRLAKGGDSQWLLVAAFDDVARVRRVYGSVDAVEKSAVDFAKATGDPVLVGAPRGLGGDGLPIFESCGRVVTAKADPLSPEAFEQWARSMAANVLAVSRQELLAMGIEALDQLDIDFRNMSPAQLERALLGYRTAISTPSARMVNLQRLEIDKALRRVITRVGGRASRIPEVRAGIGTGFSIPDREAARLLSRHHSFWVRDRYGQISDSMSAQARAIIARGVERGLDSRTIARDLRRMTGTGLRQEHYYRTVAQNHVARARSYTLGSSLRAAGIRFYRIEAVLDDRTTHQCVFLHGKVLPVGPGAANIERTMRSPNPEAVLANQPFIVERNNQLVVPTPGGGEATVATIERHSSGASPTGVDATFSGGMSSADLVSHAIGFPPYHHGCRTTVVPA
jgi:SPP1 gp7 family putative phage head morphogenesis protein